MNVDKMVCTQWYCISLSLSMQSEEAILKHRHVYLRRDSSQYNLRLRSSIGMAIREFLVKQHGSNICILE